MTTIDFGGQPFYISRRRFEELVAEALEAPAASLLFLDDGQENVDAARAEGWQAETIDPFGDVAAQISALLGARGLLAAAG